MADSTKTDLADGNSTDPTSWVLGESEEMPANTPTCMGYDFNLGVTFEGVMNSHANMGFQATNLGLAINEINRMRRWRLSDVEVKETDDEELKDPEFRKKGRASIFLSYTSNQISGGQREIIKFLVQHKLVDVIVSTAGGIEEDFIKCFRPTYMGSFHGPKGGELRKKVSLSEANEVKVCSERATRRRKATRVLRIVASLLFHSSLRSLFRSSLGRSASEANERANERSEGE